jgi:hypothetical protein
MLRGRSHQPLRAVSGDSIPITAEVSQHIAIGQRSRALTVSPKIWAKLILLYASRERELEENPLISGS